MQRVGVYLLLGLTLSFIILLFNIHWLQPISDISTYNARRLLQLAYLFGLSLLVLCLPAYLQRCLAVFATWSLKARLALMVLFACGAISASLSLFPTYAFLQLSLYYLLFMGCLALIVLRNANSRLFDRAMIISLAVACGVYALYVLYVTASYVSAPQAFKAAHPWFPLDILSPGYINFRYLAQALSLLVPLTVLPNLYIKPRSLCFRVVFFLINALSWYLLILNHSRALWLEVILMGLFMFALWRRHSMPWLRAQLRGLFAGGLIYCLLVYGLGASIPFELNLTTSAGRLALWRHTLMLIHQHPVWGVGPLHFAYYFPFHDPQFSAWLSHPHNAILLIAVEWGLPACIAMLFLSLLAIRAWWRLQHKVFQCDNPRTVLLYISLSAAAIAIGTHCMFSGLFIAPLGQCVIMVLLAWMISLFQSNPLFSPAPSAPNAGATATWLARLLLVLALYGVFNGIHTGFGQWRKLQQISLRQLCYKHHISCLYTPSFWLQSRLKLLAARRYF